MARSHIRVIRATEIIVGPRRVIQFRGSPEPIPETTVRVQGPVESCSLLVRIDDVDKSGLASGEVLRHLCDGAPPRKTRLEIRREAVAVARREVADSRLDERLLTQSERVAAGLPRARRRA